MATSDDIPKRSRASTWALKRSGVPESAWHDAEKLREWQRLQRPRNLRWTFFCIATGAAMVTTFWLTFGALVLTEQVGLTVQCVVLAATGIGVILLKRRDRREDREQQQRSHSAHD